MDKKYTKMLTKEAVSYLNRLRKAGVMSPDIETALDMAIDSLNGNPNTIKSQWWHSYTRGDGFEIWACEYCGSEIMLDEGEAPGLEDYPYCNKGHKMIDFEFDWQLRGCLEEMPTFSK